MDVILEQKGRDPLYKIWNRIDGHMIINMCSDGGNIVFHDKLLPIEKGVLCYIGPDMYHYTLPDVVQNYVRNKIFISKETFPKILELIPKESNFYKQFSEKKVLYAKIPEDVIPKVEVLFKEANKAYENSLIPDFICAYFKLMIYIEKYATENISATSGAVSKVIEYINFNYHNSLSLDEICNVAYVSKHHLCRTFKKAMGMTIMEYVLSTRISVAKKMLLKGDCPVGEISEKCGFSSFAYFCQAFKEATGMSAKQYRNTK